MRLTHAVVVLLTLFPLSVHAQGTRTDPLPLARIRQVIRAQQRQINACYVNTHRVRPRMPPHIDMTFTIGADGRVRNVRFPPDVETYSLGMCLGRLMQAWQFPLPFGGYSVTVDYPFDF